LRSNVDAVRQRYVAAPPVRYGDNQAMTRKRFDAGARPPASPPCYRHEVDQPPLDGAELIAWLNGLLEGERAGAQGLNDLAKQHAEPIASLLREVARDEGRFCVMLRRHIVALGGEPSAATGVFYDKLMARETLADQLELLDRGQGAVVRSLEATLPRLTAPALVADLTEMLDVHVVNIERCADPQLLR
jgi:Domain of unknown function (DUF6306)